MSPEAPRAGLQACGVGVRCELVPNGSYTSCFSPGSSFAGGPCQADRDCPASLLCLASRCTQACDASARSCASAQVCSGFVVYAGQSVGSCCSIPKVTPAISSNCGCAANETCDRYDTGGNFCRAVPANPVAAYARCEPGTECAQGYSCVGVACTRLCNTDADCAGDGELCIATGDAAGNINTQFRVCARGCNVLAPFESSDGFRACGEGTVCSAYPATEADVVLSRCGRGQRRRALSVRYDCAPGLVCASGACGEPCQVGGTSCGVNGECRAIGEFAGRDFGAAAPSPRARSAIW